MSRPATLLLPALALLSQAACMSLDGLIIPARPTDAYELNAERVPSDALELVTFTAADGQELHGLWARQPSAAPPLIFFHGNGGNIDHYIGRVDALWDWGTHDVFTFDYRGFGRSPGPPTRDGILLEDGLAAVNYVAETTGVDPARIPWVSLSLGSAVAVHTSPQIDAAVIVVESMFPSARALGNDGVGLDLPEGWFFRESWDNLAAISRAAAPVLVIHGTEDTFIDSRYALDVYEAAPQPKALWQPEGVGHSDLHQVDPDGWRTQVLDWIATHAPDDDPPDDDTDAETSE